MNSPLRKPFRYTYSNSALMLIGINLGIFLLSLLRPRFVTYFLGLNPILLWEEGFFWQPLTYMFVHGNMGHIVLNMLGLFFFAPQVEERMGTREFLLFYFSTGILAGILSAVFYWVTGMNQVFLVGASGALFGVLFAFAVYYPNARVFLFGLIPLRAVSMVLGFTALELFSSLTAAGQGVAHMTHLAGFLLAFLYFLIRLGMNPYTIFHDVFRGSGGGDRGPWG